MSDDHKREGPMNVGNVIEEGCMCPNCRMGRMEEKLDIVLRLVRKINAQTVRTIADLMEPAPKKPVDRKALEKAVENALDGMGTDHTDAYIAAKIVDEIMEVL